MSKKGNKLVQIFVCKIYNYNKATELLTLFPPIEAVVVCEEEPAKKLFGRLKEIFKEQDVVSPEISAFDGKKATHYIIHGQEKLTKI